MKAWIFSALGDTPVFCPLISKFSFPTPTCDYIVAYARNKVDVQFKNCIPRASQEQFMIPTFIIILSMKPYYKI